MVCITEYVNKETFELVKKEFNPVILKNEVGSLANVSNRQMIYYHKDFVFPVTETIVFNIIPHKLAVCIKHESEDE